MGRVSTSENNSAMARGSSFEWRKAEGSGKRWTARASYKQGERLASHEGNREPLEDFKQGNLRSEIV